MSHLVTSARSIAPPGPSGGEFHSSQSGRRGHTVSGTADHPALAWMPFAGFGCGETGIVRACSPLGRPPARRQRNWDEWKTACDPGCAERRSAARAGPAAPAPQREPRADPHLTVVVLAVLGQLTAAKTAVGSPHSPAARPRPRTSRCALTCGASPACSRPSRTLRGTWR